MRFTAGHVVALALGLAVVVGFDRWSGRTDRWEQRLDSAVVATKQALQTDSVELAAKLAADSAVTAEALAKADEEQVRRIGIAHELGRTRVELSQARTLKDTAEAQARVIAQQDSALASDSAQKAALRSTINGKDQTILDLREGLATANRRIADLLSVVDRRPKEFKLLGFTLSLKPYVGIGANVSPAGKVSTGLQLGVSILRG